ncbi:MAG: DUF116 domain-containing protein [Nitrososphaerota archaeon]
MPYKFNFDLSQISQPLFKEIARICNEKNIHIRIGEKVRYLIEKFRIPEITGLGISDAITIIEDLIDINIRNLLEKEKFLKTNKRALFLPHCSRKYMDNRCKAYFNPEVPSYYCNHCSPDCLINQATILAKKYEYDVYVVAGGSCIPKILKDNPYEGIVGVACCEELKLGSNYLRNLNIPGQGIPLIKNGCANTKFSIESLEIILREKTN